jgi:hypothetical protein
VPGPFYRGSHLLLMQFTGTGRPGGHDPPVFQQASGQQFVLLVINKCNLLFTKKAVFFGKEIKLFPSILHITSHLILPPDLLLP